MNPITIRVLLKQIESQLKIWLSHDRLLFINNNRINHVYLVFKVFWRIWIKAYVYSCLEMSINRKFWLASFWATLIWAALKMGAMDSNAQIRANKEFVAYTAFRDSSHHITPRTGWLRDKKTKKSFLFYSQIDYFLCRSRGTVFFTDGRSYGGAKLPYIQIIRLWNSQSCCIRYSKCQEETSEPSFI